MSAPGHGFLHRPRRPRRWVAGVLGGLLAAAPVVALPAAAEAAPRVTWSDRDVVAGAKVTATVKPGSVPESTTVVLQRRFPDAWRVADRTATTTGGGLELRAPTKQYGSFVYRVAAVDGATAVETSDPVTVTVAPPYEPAGSASARRFMTTPRWQWDSCRTITWKINIAGSPKAALKQVQGSFARIHAATGLEFVYAGRTTQTPRTAGVNGTDIVVGWLGRRAFADKFGGAVGVGGASYYTGWKLHDGTTVHRAASGGVVLNGRYNGDLGTGFGNGYTWGDVLMHEIGHVIGLDHVADDRQMMHDTITRGAARWGAGDLSGFATIGDTGGCLIPANERALTPRRAIAHDAH